MCPVCGNPICHMIAITCKYECVLFDKTECYQHNKTRDKYGTCRCDYDDIMYVFGQDWSRIELTGHQKMAEIKNYLLHGSSSVLPEELFEI